MASVIKILDSDVANGATVTVNYSNDMGYPLSTGHYVNINNNQYDLADGEIGVALGDTSAVITNNTGRTWLKGRKLSVEFVEPENITIKKVSSAQYSSISPKREDIFYAVEDDNLVGTAQIEDYTASEINGNLNAKRVNASASALSDANASSMKYVGGSGLLIISDSTGITPSETEGWPYLVAEALATKYTNSAVMVRFWDAGSQVYNNWTNLNTENESIYIDMSAPDGQARTRILSHEIIGSFTDLDVRFDVELLDYTPASTSVIGGAWGSSGSRGHRVRINTDGSIGYQWTEDGSTEKTTNSTTSAGLTDGERYQIRIVHDVDNGAGGNDVSFYYRQIGVDAWTQIGTTITNSGTTSIAQPARNYEIGGTLGQFVTAGKYFGVEARDGEDGANIMPQPITLFGGAEDLSPLAGSPTIFVTIGAQSGGAINRSDNPANSFVDATRLPKMVEKWYSALSVILNTGHNEENENLDLKTDLDGWLSDMQGILPFADYIVMTQNPRLNASAERHRRQIGQILGWGKRNDLSVIDTYRAYLKDPRGVAALLQVDEVHPNADGAIVEASAIIDCLS